MRTLLIVNCLAYVYYLYVSQLTISTAGTRNLPGVNRLQNAQAQTVTENKFPMWHISSFYFVSGIWTAYGALDICSQIIESVAIRRYWNFQCRITTHISKHDPPWQKSALPWCFLFMYIGLCKSLFIYRWKV